MSRSFFALLLAYVASRAVLAAINFRYAPFSDPFDGKKMAVDFGVWVICFAAAKVVLGRRRSSQAGV